MTGFIVVLILIYLIVLKRTPAVPGSSTQGNTLPEQVYRGYVSAINDNCSKYNVPVPRVVAIICVESRGVSTVIGNAGEIGLMQILPSASLVDYNKANPLYPVTKLELTEPAKNIRVGVWYLHWLAVNFFGGNMNLATQAYNAGLANVKNDPARGTGYLEKVLVFENQFKSVISI